MYALVDCNNFYASCERVFNPTLNNKPIVVLSNNDGCVIALSNEAKKFNIPVGEPLFKIKHLIEQKNIQVFSSNFPLYGDMSTRVMKILKNYSPEIEIYSIDEAFLKLNNLYKLDTENYCLSIVSTVKQNTQIPISIGVASTKALSKVANRIAKKFPDRTKGVYIIDSEEKRIKALRWLKIEDVWGIGRQLSKKLKKINVFTALDFTQLSDNYVRREFSVVGLRLKKDLEGSETLKLEKSAKKKSIATTRTFETDYTNYGLVLERITTFAVTNAEKLRKQNSVCKEIRVFILSNRFKKNREQHNKSITLKLPFPTNSSIELAKFAKEALKRIYKENVAYKKAGVVVSDLVDASNYQTQLFASTDSRHKPLMQTFDGINKEYGTHKIKLASQDPNRKWKMKQEQLSNRYTTSWDELLKVK